MYIKEKCCKYRQYFNATRHVPDEELNALEKRIETICGSFQMHGDENTDELGFGFSDYFIQ